MQHFTKNNQFVTTEDTYNAVPISFYKKLIQGPQVVFSPENHRYHFQRPDERQE